MTPDLMPYRQPAEPPSAPTPAPAIAPRIGGAALVINGLFILAESALGVADQAEHHGPPLVGPAVFDVGLGIALCLGNERVRPWVLFRTVAGLLVFGALGAARGDWGLVAFQVVISLSLLGLIAGRAGRVRIAAATVTLGLCFFLELIGLVFLRGGLDNLATTAASLNPSFVHPTPAELRGVRGRFRLPVPANWMAVTQQAAHADNALTDQVIAHPATDSRVFVISETIRPDQFMDPQRLLQTMLDNGRQSTTDFRELRRATLPGHEDVPLAEAEATLPPVPGAPAPVRVHYYFAAVVSGAQTIQLTGFHAVTAPEPTGRAVLDAMRGFEVLPMEGLPGNAGGADGRDHVQPVEGNVLRGREFQYELRVSPGWYLRNQADAAADNNVIDRWLLRPYENTSLFVLAERADEGTAFTTELYVDAVRRSLAVESPTWRDPEALLTRGGEGTLLSYDTTVEGRTMRFLVGVVVTPTVAYRVVASCDTTRFAAREAEMRAMIASLGFAPPAPPAPRRGARR